MYFYFNITHEIKTCVLTISYTKNMLNTDCNFALLAGDINATCKKCEAYNYISL